MSRHPLALAAAVLFPLVGATQIVAHEPGLAIVLSGSVGQAPAADPAREQMNDLLARARQAMAEGNLETADSLISRAEGLNVTIGFFHTGDSPKKARRDWQKLRELRTTQPGAGMPAPAVPNASAPAPASAATGAAPYPTTSAAAEPMSPFGRPTISTPPAEDRLGRMTNLAAPTATPANFAPPADARPVAVQPLPTVDPEVRPASASEPIAASAPPAAEKKLQALELVRQSRAALAAGNITEAERLASQADTLAVPDEAFGPQDDRAWLVLMEVEKVRRRGPVTQAATTNAPAAPFPGVRAVYDPAADSTRNVPASADGQPSTASELPNPQPGPTTKFVLPPVPAVSPSGLKTATPATAVEPISPGKPGRNELIEETAQSQNLLARQLASDITKLEAQAEQAQATDPAQAAALLQQARVLVEKSAVNDQSKQVLLRRIDRELAELAKYAETNRPRIELAERNREVMDTMDREQQAKIDMQQRLATLIDEYNMLIDQQRFAEAEVLAKRAAEIGPNEPIVGQLQQQSKALRRMFNNAEMRSMLEDNTVAAYYDNEKAMIPWDESKLVNFPKNWTDIKTRRLPFITDAARRSPKELEIEQKLRMPVSLKFDKVTLSQAFEKLGAMTGVPFYLDQRGLAAEGIDSSTPISIDLNTEISLKSALNILLAEHHLTFVIKDEVLKITSDRMRSEDVYTVTYPVGDLVIPIPNFSPSNRMGLSGALADAQAAIMNYGSGMGLASHAPISVMASNAPGVNDSVLGQVNVPFVSGGGGGASGQPQNVGFGLNGPGGMGGGVRPDFDSLIELITSTIRQQDWQDNGGTIGFIKQHDTTLSLVITHDVRGHEEIENLLTQLRKLQDLQVTIEVRFITLNDSFYEQIGVDFDMDINDNIDKQFQIFGRPNTLDPSEQNRSQFTPAATLSRNSGNPPRDVQDRDLSGSQSVTVGMSAPGVFSSDLDIPFNNTSLGQMGTAFTTGLLNPVTTQGGIAPGGASVGFAILSDLEAYFFINAVQDDQRSNILQAPKVTMFNGQQAFVSDTQQVPFVISVIPVVGSFAMGQQPVIVVLNEGTSLSVQAVVSNDRRFVRMTMVPFFSQIGDVNTFTFEGSESSTSTSASATSGPGTETTDEETSTTRSGTTVQLPTFAFQTVTTTVSVPDGGTILLGGIKRMREARSEDGIPMISKIPYINRLFTNVAIAKSSQSLMMMVTPRIIIQEEEEAAIGIAGSP